MVSSAYPRLLIFLPKILIPVCTSSSPAFLMMYSAYRLNKQGDNIQSRCSPFPIWNQFQIVVWTVELSFHVHFFFFFFTGIFFFILICSEFCHTLKWNVLEFTCLPHPDPPLPAPSPPAPSRSSASTRSERLSHASNLGWWTVSHIPPLHSPTESKRLFYKFVSLFLFWI